MIRMREHFKVPTMELSQNNLPNTFRLQVAEWTSMNTLICVSSFRFVISSSNWLHPERVAFKSTCERYLDRAEPDSRKNTKFKYKQNIHKFYFFLSHHVTWIEFTFWSISCVHLNFTLNIIVKKVVMVNFDSLKCTH